MPSREQKSDDREPDPGAVDTALRQDLITFAARCFRNLNPQAALAINWHLEVIAAKLTGAGRAARRTVAQTVSQNPSFLFCDGLH